MRSAAAPPPLDAESVRKLLQSGGGLPSVPAVVTSVLTLLENPRASFAEVGRAISMDQALTAKVLKLVNSAYYGFPREIATVTHALILLGLDTVKDLVVTASVMKEFSADSLAAFDPEAFWLHSLGCAVATKAVAEHLRYRASGEAFAAGVLHDIGKLLLARHYPDLTELCVHNAKEERLSMRQAELGVIGVDHAEVGGWLAEAWNFPPAMAAAIRYHHRPLAASEEDSGLVAMVHIGNVVVRRAGFGDGGGGDRAEVDAELLKSKTGHKLRLHQLAVDEVVAELPGRMEGAQAFLRVLDVGKDEKGK
ncbi:MAG: HDOD domain-containing protein [Candidatus Schekmanbacteria bacterium]|nr:HDOD domain-containing protein [Candidatus Schekmanbacteria bacterium]